MVFLLVIATLVAPIAALIFADWWREHKRQKRAGARTPTKQAGWVSDTITKFNKGKENDQEKNPG